MPIDPFFESSPQEHSLIKTELVAKYFDAWSKIMLNRNKANTIGFVDLFSGAGSFRVGDEEVESTPLQISRKVISDSQLQKHVRLFFNDKKPDHIDALRKRIEDLEHIDQLRYAPAFSNTEVGQNLYGALSSFASFPTIYFIDPYGYKGMSTDLVRRLISGWGSECVFFFNYDAINRAINNDVVSPLMQEIFGAVRAEKLPGMVAGASSKERERIVLQGFRDTLKENGSSFTIAFRFLRPGMKRTSHYIVFASKAFRGYDVMRDIMARTGHYQNAMPMFEWAPGARQAELNLDQPKQRAMDAMEQILISHAAGTNDRVDKVYERFSVDTPFIKKAFKDVLRAMEEKGLISIDPPADARKKGTLADHCVVNFPKQGG